ncbi:hypothetical protein ACFCZJ_16140 [Streptomyces rubiginosohelvolus]|uniref:hypothetical protein n=1 Tax=Streptomyces rubiginosohelvolus TaxID=67362 RepID=UPI0035D57530
MIDTSDIGAFLGLDVGKGEHHATALTPAGKKALDRRLRNSEPTWPVAAGHDRCPSTSPRDKPVLAAGPAPAPGPAPRTSSGRRAWRSVSPVESFPRVGEHQAQGLTGGGVRPVERLGDQEPCARFGAPSLALVPLLSSPAAHAAAPAAPVAEVTTLAGAVGLVKVTEEDRTGYTRSSCKH